MLNQQKIIKKTKECETIKSINKLMTSFWPISGSNLRKQTTPSDAQSYIGNRFLAKSVNLDFWPNFSLFEIIYNSGPRVWFSKFLKILTERHSQGYWASFYRFSFKSENLRLFFPNMTSLLKEPGLARVWWGMTDNSPWWESNPRHSAPSPSKNALKCILWTLHFFIQFLNKKSMKIKNAIK